MEFHLKFWLYKLILDNFGDEHTRSEEIRTLWQDLQNVRLDRIKSKAMPDLSQGVLGKANLDTVGLLNIASIELLPIRKFLTLSLGMFSQMSELEQNQNNTVFSGGDNDNDDRGADGNRRRANRLKRGQL